MTYRETTPRCPMCTIDLLAREITPEGGKAEEIDVCPTCGAVWLDWFDGEAPGLIAEHLRVASQPEGLRDMLRPEKLLCPICHTGLVDEQWQGGVAHVHRCRECAGMMVPHDSFAAIATFEDPKHAEPQTPQGPWARLVAIVRALLAGERAP